MALFDIFKKKKKSPLYKPKKKPEKKPSAPIKPQKPKKISKTARLPKLGTGGQAYKVLKGPHVTEKATDLSQKNLYVFKVFPEVNKLEIKKAVEGLYGVNVVSVKIINVPSRKRRLGRIEGERQGYKKAIVRIAEGQKIEILPR